MPAHVTGRISSGRQPARAPGLGDEAIILQGFDKDVCAIILLFSRYSKGEKQAAAVALIQGLLRSMQTPQLAEQDVITLHQAFCLRIGGVLIPSTRSLYNCRFKQEWDALDATKAAMLGRRVFVFDWDRPAYRSCRFSRGMVVEHAADGCLVRCKDQRPPLLRAAAAHHGSVTCVSLPLAEIPRQMHVQ